MRREEIERRRGEVNRGGKVEKGSFIYLFSFLSYANFEIDFSIYSAKSIINNIEDFAIRESLVEI